MANKANQSVTITFSKAVAGGGDQEGNLVVELDEEKNAGKSQFLYGEKAYFKVYKYPASMVLTLTSTDGAISSEGSGTSPEEENIAFSNTNEASSSKPVKSIDSSMWFGASLGSVSADGSKITASQSGIGVLNLKYKSDFLRYAIVVPVKDYDEYPVIVFISGE